MSAPKRIVVKIGSSLLADTERLVPRFAFMHGLLSDIADLKAEGHDVVLTSSGAVALGLSTIGKTPGSATVLEKQAAAACGQPRLLNAYRQVALEHGIEIAQVLVTLDDMEQRRRYLNTKNTLSHLFDGSVLPIVNENDSVATQELKVGDNDRLAAKVAQMIQADLFIILTSVDGLYDRNPDEKGAKLVEQVEDVTGYLDVTSGASELGSGGMLTKMQAANLAQNAGVTTIIGRGTTERPILDLLNGKRPCTTCIAKEEAADSFDVWLTNRLQVAGSLVVSKQAATALSGEPDTDIDAADIVSVQGEFSKGDVVHLFAENGDEIARGMSNYSANEVLMLARDQDNSVLQLLGDKASPEIVGADNLVVLDDNHLAWEAPEDEMLRIA